MDWSGEERDERKRWDVEGGMSKSRTTRTTRTMTTWIQSSL
jgi:hypothetical protein